MVEIVLASNNKKKKAELETLIGKETSNGVKILSLQEIGFVDEIIENGETFEENCLIKASTPAKLGYIGIADDSGLAVDYLNGAPGVYSARYSGGDDADNRVKLFADLEGVPDEKRTARFVCTSAIVLPENSEYKIPEEWQISAQLSEKSGISRERAMIVRGEVEGIIAHEEKGTGGFGYDCMFYYPPFGKNFAEVTQEQKDSVSHRGKAMREICAKIVKVFEL